MSYDRSPRPVCSMTIGTSICLVVLSVLPHSRPNNDRLGGGGAKIAALRGLAIQEIEGFLVADSISDSIQRSIPCQSSADGLRGLLRLFCDRLNFLLHFLVAYLNFLFFRDLFQQQRRFYVLYRLVSLSGAKAGKVHFLDVFGAHALCGKRANAPLQADVYLMLHQRLRNLKLIALYQFGD